MSAESTQLELVRGMYRPVSDLCQGEIRVAFNQLPGLFIVVYNTIYKKNVMLRTPMAMSVWNAAAGYGSYPWEILLSFADAHQQIFIFKDNNETWGYFDTETGQWRGAVAMVRAYIISIGIEGTFSYFFYFIYS